MLLARLPLALAILALLLLVAAIAGLRWLPTASAAGASTHCGAVQMGTAAGETLEGTAGRDVIRGKGGNDLIKGRKSGDCLRGGLGDDTVRGGAGHDFLRGGPGRDRLVARDGERDVVRCGHGKDLALVGAKDKVRHCERVRRHASGGGQGGRAGYPSFPRSDWNGGFDPGCQLVGPAPGAWDSNQTNGGETNTLGSTRIERNMVGQGECGAKFTNAASSDQTRSELERSPTGANPEFTYEMLVRVPSGQTFPKGVSISQTKQEKSGGRGCYNGGWGITDGTGATGGGLQYRTVFACTSPQDNGQRTFRAGALPRGRWFALKVHEKFSNKPRIGFVKAWIDVDGLGPGRYLEVIPKTHVDNVTGRHVRLRVGQYRQDTGHRTTVYIDGVRLECEARC
jgi:Polysaccharide lyase/RTX calcium-binding nonapeptide repeat (4 copies)